jgi:hypothetical protein
VKPTSEDDRNSHSWRHGRKAYRAVEHASGPQMLDQGPGQWESPQMRDHPIPLTRGVGLGGVDHSFVPGSGHTTGRTEGPKSKPRKPGR